MPNLLRQLWSDDQGAVISTELILVLTVLIFGIIPGLVALRNSIIAAYGNIGNTLVELVPSFTYSGFVVGPVGATPGPSNIALINGYEAGSTPTVLAGALTTPLIIGFNPIPPAP
jgi:Flp pilus assembly pilin Flp